MKVIWLKLQGFKESIQVKDTAGEHILLTSTKLVGKLSVGRDYIQSEKHPSPCMLTQQVFFFVLFVLSLLVSIGFSYKLLWEKMLYINGLYQ